VPCGDPWLGHMAPFHSPRTLTHVNTDWSTTLPCHPHVINTCRSTLPQSSPTHLATYHIISCIVSTTCTSSSCSSQPATLVVWPCHVGHRHYGPTMCQYGPLRHVSTVYPVNNPCHPATCQYSISHMMPRVSTATSCTDLPCIDCTVNIFSCLAKQTKHNISRIRHPFEPIQVALGSWGQGLHTSPF
jgi:hypothetical protein